MSDIETSDWSELAANNIQPAPAGWPANSSPMIVYSNGREDMGAIKRDWNRRNPTVTSGGSVNAQTLTFTQGPVAYVTGQTYAFFAGFSNSGAVTLNVNGLGAKAIQLNGAALAAGAIIAGSITQCVYDGTQFQLTLAGSGAYLLLTGGALTGALSINPGNLSVIGNISIAPASGTASITVSAVAGNGAFFSSIVAGARSWGAGQAAAGNYTINDNTAGAARLTIAATGQVGLAGGMTVGAGAGATLAGSGMTYVNYNAGNAAVAWAWSSPTYTGWINNTNVGTITPVVCDVRLKQRVGAIEGDSLDELNRLELVSYDLPDLVERDRPARHFGCGFTAQQVEGVVPEAVVMASGTPEETMLSLDPLPLLARSVAAIQQLSAKVTELTAKVTRLEAGLAVASQA